MAAEIKIRPASGTWVVRAGGAVLGESDNALEFCEGDLSPVIFFPRGDIATEFLDPSEKANASSPMGEVSYFSIVTKSTTLHDAAWSYESPTDTAAEISGYLAFDTGDLVAVEKL